jgi:hypothetical protein
LDQLGFIWDPADAAWEKGFSYLKIYEEREGHCRVPTRHMENNFKLGLWLQSQRQNLASLSDERRKRLTEFGFEPHDTRWEQGFNHLAIFKEREGHCLVHRTHKENGFRLGQWMGTQRQTKDSLSAERRERLNRLGFIWNALDANWEKGFSYLKVYRDREGHCRVPFGYKENGFELGNWVAAQRAHKDAISAEQKARLDELGFIWKASEKGPSRSLGETSTL